MAKGKPNRRYGTEFKTKLIETMRREGLNYSEASRWFVNLILTMQANGPGSAVRQHFPGRLLKGDIFGIFRSTVFARSFPRAGLTRCRSHSV